MMNLLKIKPMICEQCGGHVDRKTMRCPYCGTEYAYSNNGVQIRFEEKRPGEHSIFAQVDVDMDMIAKYPDIAQSYALDTLRNEIADALLAFMKISTSTKLDPLCQHQIIRAEVRVIDPEYKK